MVNQRILTTCTDYNTSKLLTVNYAAAVALEVREPASGGEPMLRFNFKNGTGAEFITYNFLGETGDVPVSKFVNTLAVYSSLIRVMRTYVSGTLDSPPQSIPPQTGVLPVRTHRTVAVEHSRLPPPKDERRLGRALVR